MHADLNLLRAFDALLEENSVMGAANRLHLSQPAMSRTLGRIRALTGDRILVRTGRTMTPTTYALLVREEVHRLVHEASAVLTPQRQVDLETLKRTFTIQSHDLLISTIAPALLLSTHREAPGVTLRFLAEGPVDTNDLRRGLVDMHLGATTPTLPELHHEVLATGHLVITLREGHPLLAGPLTLSRYAAADHVVVTRRGRTHDLIDDTLEQHGLQRRVVAAVPNVLSALRIVQSSDIISAIPAESIKSMTTVFGLRTLAIPMSLPPVLAISSWHHRYDTDHAHIWLRTAVRHAFKQVGSTLTPGGQFR